MIAYNEQRELIQTRSDITSGRESRVLAEVVCSIDKAEKQGRMLSEILKAAKTNREFCLHCDSIAKLIEEVIAERVGVL